MGCKLYIGEYMPKLNECMLQIIDWMLPIGKCMLQIGELEHEYIDFMPELSIGVLINGDVVGVTCNFELEFICSLFFPSSAFLLTFLRGDTEGAFERSFVPFKG